MTLQYHLFLALIRALSLAMAPEINRHPFGRDIWRLAHHGQVETLPDRPGTSAWEFRAARSRGARLPRLSGTGTGDAFRVDWPDLIAGRGLFRMLESLITAYGYPVIVIGTFFEGETILILGGLSAHLGYLSLSWVILGGFCGSLLGNQLWFFLGRRYGDRLLTRRPSLRGRVDLVLRRLERRHSLVILGFPFVYGFRVVTPIAIGMSGVPYWRFLLLNAAGVAAWAICIGCAGFFFGQAVETVLGDLKRYELALVSVIVAVGAVIWLVHFSRGRAVQRGAGDQ